MGARLRQVDEAAHRGRAAIRELGDELREARIRAGLRQSQVARAIGRSQSQVSEVELGRHAAVSMLDLARHAGAVGLKLHARMYPAGAPLRDQAQLDLLERFRKRLSPDFRVRIEVPLAPLTDPRDQRAWDMVITIGALALGVEAYSRLRDVQAQVRAAQLKREAGGVQGLVLLVAATHANRRALAGAAPLLQAAFPISTRAALRTLAAGTDPGGDALIVL